MPKSATNRQMQTPEIKKPRRGESRQGFEGVNNFEVIHVENHSTNVIPFKFDERPVRTLLIGDEPWFVAADVCEALELSGRHRNFLRMLDEDEKGAHIVSTLGGPQEIQIVSESGLYSLIFKSRKAEAKRFKKWVTSVVLPAIRKHGRFEDTSDTMHTLIGEVIGTSGFRCLAAVMDGKVAHLPKPLRVAARNHLWSQVHKAFSVVTAEDIPASQMNAARNFIGAYALEGQWLPRQEPTNDFDYPAAWIWRNNPTLVSEPRQVNGRMVLFLGLKSMAPSEFKSALQDVVRRLKAKGADTRALELELAALRELMRQHSSLMDEIASRISDRVQHIPFFPVPEQPEPHRPTT